MTTQTFETSKGTLLAVRLPEGSFGMIINNYADESELLYTVDGDDDSLRKIKLPPGDWKEIGLWGSVTEENAKEVVDVRGGAYHFSTALATLHSLFETGISLRNTKSHPADINPTSRAHYDKLSDEWQSAEAEVWKHFYLIFKTK